MDYRELLKESKRIGLGQIDGEWLRFIEFLDNVRPKNILEIGSKRGGSAYTLANFATNLICVDMVDKLKVKKEISEKCNFNFIIGDSRKVNTINAVKEILDNNNIKLDLIFIDGDHTYEGAKSDFENYSKFMNTGGHVVFHDIVRSEKHVMKKCLVFKLWNEIKSNNPNTIEYLGGANWAGIGIVRI